MRAAAIASDRERRALGHCAKIRTIELAALRRSRLDVVGGWDHQVGGAERLYAVVVTGDYGAAREEAEDSERRLADVVDGVPVGPLAPEAGCCCRRPSAWR